MGSVSRPGVMRRLCWVIWLWVTMVTTDSLASAGIRRRAWGRVHMMRSGKRSFQDSDSDGHWIQDSHLPQDGVDNEVPDIGDESADLGIDLEALDNSELRRVTRSGSVGQQTWTQRFLRSLRDRSGLSRRGGRRSWFGGGHMMRSGKRSSWGSDEERI